MSSKRRNDSVLNDIKTFRAAASDTDIAIFNFFSALDTPRSLCCWLLYSNGEHQQLVDLDISADNYVNGYRFRDDYNATSFLSKADFFKLAVSKKEAALKKFFEYEDLCNRTNSRLRSLHSDPSFNGPNVWLLNATIRKIESILGEFSPEELVESANWGPGVTTNLKGCHVSAVNKFHSEYGITHDLHSLVKPWFSVAYPLWSQHLISVNGNELFVPEVGNSIVTVPKNSKTDRVIAVEPGLNLWFQKGVGSMVRSRLRRVGIDLNSQDRNQNLARLSSKYDNLATIDFSSASDSISIETVRMLLPPKWFQLLDCMRSKVGIYDKKPLIWQKFSSMGNGFTFELESLIFFAAAFAVREYVGSSDSISVYGDDVIIPSSCSELFSSFSTFLGFRVNKQKSFSSGYFRESCGAHYYDGIDCKPIFLKEKLNHVQSIYKLANNVRRLAHRHNSYYGCDARFYDAWRHLSRRVPKHFRFVIPDGLGDGGFIGNFDEATPAYTKDGIEGYLFSALVESGKSQMFEQEGLLLTRLKVRSIQEYGNNYTLRGQTRIRVSRILVSRWCNLGGWL